MKATIRNTLCRLDGEAIRRRRVRLKKTQRDVADEIRAILRANGQKNAKTSPQTVSKWESERQDVPGDTLIALCLVLKTTPEKLSRPVGMQP